MLYTQVLKAYLNLIPVITALGSHRMRAELNATYLPLRVPAPPGVTLGQSNTTTMSVVAFHSRNA